MERLELWNLGIESLEPGNPGTSGTIKPLEQWNPGTREPWNHAWSPRTCATRKP